MDTRLRLAVLMAVVALSAAALLVAVLWPDDSSTQWQAVAAVATSVIAIATIVGLATLFFIYQQGRQSQQRFRVELGPYLRVDFAPDVEWGSWDPPNRDSIDNLLTFEDINPGEEPDLGPLAGWSGNVDLCVWIRNLQQSPAGVADNIRLRILMEVPDPEGEAVSEVEFLLTIAYLAPGQHVRYLIASVSSDIPRLSGRVDDVRYTDLYGREFKFAHGSTEFEWVDRSVVNERTVFRTE